MLTPGSGLVDVDRTEAMEAVLGLVDLPFVCPTTFQDKRLGTIYAVMMHASLNHWCHEVVDGVSPWHRTEAAAWECFDANHPRVREALAVLRQDDDGR